MNTAFIDDLLRRVQAALPKDVDILKSDIQHNLHAALKSVLSKMDLVTREEFDIQCAVLQRSREKLQALETTVAELEQNLSAHHSE